MRGYSNALGSTNQGSPGLSGGSEQYSREELTAKMDATLLCAMTGTDLPVFEN